MGGIEDAYEGELPEQMRDDFRKAIENSGASLDAIIQDLQQINSILKQELMLH